MYTHVSIKIVLAKLTIQWLHPMGIFQLLALPPFVIAALLTPLPHSRIPVLP